MSIYRLQTCQKLPISLEEAWDFISSPYNLKKITPEYMGFEITNGIKESDKMFAGQIIAYKINILPFVKSEWVTEISHVKDKDYFVDEQRFGPYSFWHHKHQLIAIDGGVEMHDTVNYKIPFGIFGRLAHSIFIKRQLKSIFEYRTDKMNSIFGRFKE